MKLSSNPLSKLQYLTLVPQLSAESNTFIDMLIIVARHDHNKLVCCMNSQNNPVELFLLIFNTESVCKFTLLNNYETEMAPSNFLVNNLHKNYI